MAGITVTAKEVERISHKLGEEAESFFREEADVALSDRVISIKAVPVNKMYVCLFDNVQDIVYSKNGHDIVYS